MSNPIFVSCLLSSLAVVDCLITVARRVAVRTESFKFHPNHVLLLNEVLKLLFAAVQVVSRKRKSSFLRAHLRRVLFDSVHMIPICALYLVANLISYPALERVPVSVFASVSQLKVLTTAFFTVLLLKKPVSLRRWRTLTTLMLGVIVVTLTTAPDDDKHSATNARYYLGAFLSFIQTCLTGFACVALELLLKNLKNQQEKDFLQTDTSLDIWDRNLQLALWSIAIYVPLSVIEGDGKLLLAPTHIEILISCLHAVGGILVALSILHASSIAKTIAVCAGLVMTSLVGGLVGDTPPSLVAMTGGAIVIITIFGYRDDVDLELEP